MFKTNKWSKIEVKNDSMSGTRSNNRITVSEHIV